MDERSLSTKVFTIIEISNKKWWKQKLWREYRALFHLLEGISIHCQIFLDEPDSKYLHKLNQKNLNLCFHIQCKCHNNEFFNHVTQAQNHYFSVTTYLQLKKNPYEFFMISLVAVAMNNLMINIQLNFATSIFIS